MNRLWIYPALLPLLSLLSFMIALAGREWLFSIAPAGARWFDVFPFAVVLGVPFVVPAMLLDLWRNKRNEISLEELARQSALQWSWLTLYGIFLMLIHRILMPILSILGASTPPFSPLHTLVELTIDLLDPVNFSILAQSIAFLWAIERATGRKPAPSPAFLWRRWKRSWTLTTEK